ncbi:hypothetical protein MLD38_006125 [Melastoma candidum]|uniref:Uncharacterized protein n=1 Tax=Melastoma candidum TaxID=119954 RepID=A0ACB9RLZ6_9MYRT|nr:hypothetical protein MLD38_006125 [Melastoma candidum]
MQQAMWGEHADSDLKGGLSAVLEAFVAEASVLAVKTLACSLLLVASSTWAINILVKDMEISQRFPLDELHAVKKPGPENVDGSETEDDEDEDDNDEEDQEDDEDEEDDGGEANGDDEGDPEDKPEANADGNEDDDEDDDEDEDEDDDDEDEEEDEEEEEDEDELPQPPTKKRK